MAKPVLAVDFDGVLHNWRTNEPIKGAKAALRKLSREFTIVIFTTNQEGFVETWLKTNLMWKYVDGVTNMKPAAVAYVDDKAIRFGTWEQTLPQLL